jgi:hypothetical protein
LKFRDIRSTFVGSNLGKLSTIDLRLDSKRISLAIMLQNITRSFFFPLAFFLPLVVGAEEPISLEVLLDGVPVKEGGWVLTVTLQAHADLDEIRLTVVPSDGLRITAGEHEWRGSLPAGGEQVVELSFTMIARAPQEIVLHLKGRLKEGGTFEKTVIRKVG